MYFCQDRFELPANLEKNSPMKSLVTIVQNYFRHDGLYLSSHISFCALLSMIPLLLIVFSVVGFVLGTSHGVYQQLVSGITDFLPQAEDFLVQNLREVVVQRHFSGIFGVFLLIFFATLLFGAVERALDRIFEAEKSRNFFHSRLIAVILIIFISLFFFLPTVADIFTRALNRFGAHFPLGEWIRGPAFFFLFAYVAFVLVVVIIPHHQVRLRYAAFGGLIFALGIIIAKQIFRMYMLRAFVQYNVIYGSVTAFVLL
ncbi:MAG: YihY/virulence factor BrkB family protein, partial [Deltaproteobacteria bacterium]|nr:YihY/virulence factor BrkB family protein [Deltaproteobacteria bacterium]